MLALPWSTLGAVVGILVLAFLLLQRRRRAGPLSELARRSPSQDVADNTRATYLPELRGMERELDFVEKVELAKDGGNAEYVDGCILELQDLEQDLQARIRHLAELRQYAHDLGLFRQEAQVQEHIEEVAELHRRVMKIVR